jgi:Ca-activated chloride channel family protein
MKRTLAAILLLLLAHATVATAQNITITQVDPSALLLSQTVDLYLDPSGRADLDRDALRVSESADGTTYKEVRVVDVRAGANRIDGLTFLLLIDNSGSMYDTLAGAQTDDPALMRITGASSAVRSFLEAVSNPNDAVGIVSFNTRYTLLAEPTANRVALADTLDLIERPTPEEAYTELYAALVMGVDNLAGRPGRKVIIVLSDGENFPYSEHTGSDHPVFGTRVFDYEEPIDRAQREGISIFAISFAGQRDPNVETIAQETGGDVLSATTDKQLREVYLAIREQVLSEIMVTYQPSMVPAERKWVRVEYDERGRTYGDTRFYYSNILVGLPMRPLRPWLIIPFVLVVVALLVLASLRIDRQSREPNLAILNAGPGSPSTRLLPLKAQKTVIGGSPAADLTIAGTPLVRQNHATVVFEPKKKRYTLMADGDITVNHQPVKKTRVLEAGDVIDVGGTTIVFDDDVAKDTGKTQ